MESRFILIEFGLGAPAKFAGIKSLSLNTKPKKVQSLVFEMTAPKDECTYDKDLNPLLNQLFTENDYRKDDKYFIIRDASKAIGIDYRLSQEQINSLGGKSFLDKTLRQSSLAYSKEKDQHIITQSFSKPMRLMFNIEQIKMKMGKNGVMKIYSQHVKKIQKWNEN